MMIMTDVKGLLDVIAVVDAKLALEQEAEEFHLKKWGESQTLQSFTVNAMDGCEAIGKQKALIWCRMMLQQQVIKIQESKDANEDDE